MKKKASVGIIIPTYNEKENISKLIPVISKIFKENRINGEIIVVDDNSPDGTGKIADTLSKKYPVIAIHRTANRGYGASTIEGFNYGLKKDIDVLITMDCDFSHNPNMIPLMIEEIKNYNDVVIGSRRVSGGKIVGWNLWRHFCSFGATTFSRIMLGIKVNDITSGFRAYKKEVLKSIKINEIKSNGYSFLEELLYLISKKQFKIKEIAITFEDRKYGQSKLSKKEILNFFKTVLRLKFQKSPGH